MKLLAIREKSTIKIRFFSSAFQAVRWLESLAWLARSNLVGFVKNYENINCCGCPRQIFDVACDFCVGGMRLY